MYWASEDHDGYFCDLAFDVPQDTVSGVRTGIVLMEGSHHDLGHRTETCTELTRVAGSLAHFFPPGR